MRRSGPRKRPGEIRNRKTTGAGRGPSYRSSHPAPVKRAPDPPPPPPPDYAYDKIGTESEGLLIRDLYPAFWWVALVVCIATGVGLALSGYWITLGLLIPFTIGVVGKVIQPRPAPRIESRERAALDEIKEDFALDLISPLEMELAIEAVLAQDLDRPKPSLAPRRPTRRRMTGTR